MENESLIKKLPYWDALSEKEKDLVAGRAVKVEYEKDEFIDGFNDACLGMIYVVKGSVRVYITSKEGREVTLFHISENDSCILSASCVIGAISLDVQLVAEDDTEIVAVPSGTFLSLMNDNVNVKCFAYELSTRRFSTVVWVMQQILFDRFDERLARLLLSIYEKTGDKTIKMTQEDMAREVNSAREVVARMLRQFADDGLVEINRGQITLTDISALEGLLD